MAETFESLKVPPHNIEAEQAVLGGLMLDNHAWVKVADKLRPADFYREDHRLIFQALCEHGQANKPMDVVTLSDYLKDKEQLEAAGGLSYLATMAKDTPSAANIEAYADIVREKSLRRQLIETGTRITELGFQKEGAGKDLIELAAQFVYQLETVGSAQDKGFVALKEVMQRRLAFIDEVSKNLDEDGKPKLLGYSTGLDALDQRWGGLEKGKVYVIAARPKLGKTTLAQNIIEAVGRLYPELATTVFTLEMSEDEITDKFITSAGRVDFERLRNPAKITEDDWPRIASGVKSLKDAGIWLDDSSILNCGQIRSRLRRLAHETKKELGPVMVDYIQLMSGMGKHYGNRENEISEISRELKRIAKEFDVPVILVAQLNRSCESRINKRPMLSDLRESGAIEQDANVVTFLYRDEYYNEDSPDKGKAELITRAIRSGQPGTDTVVWNGTHQRFDNYAGFDEVYEGDWG